ncbi:protein-L-isoaspartate O-methyltransferase, partial [Amaricoccus sp. HAR-UPW-R2A-40]
MIDFATAREAMVDGQVRPSDVTRYPIILAMLTVPREDYVPDALREVAYLGEHVPLARGRVVLDPRVFAKMLDALAVGPGDLVLDVGCGL